MTHLPLLLALPTSIAEWWPRGTCGRVPPLSTNTFGSCGRAGLGEEQAVLTGGWQWVGWYLHLRSGEPPAPAPTYIQQGCTTCPPAHSARGWLLGHSMGALSVQSSRGEGAAGQRAAETISYGEVAREEQGERGCLVEKERDPTEVWFWLSARPCTAFGSVGVAVVVFCFSSLKSF